MHLKKVPGSVSSCVPPPFFIMICTLPSIARNLDEVWFPWQNLPINLWLEMLWNSCFVYVNDDAHGCGALVQCSIYGLRPWQRLHSLCEFIMQCVLCICTWVHQKKLLLQQSTITVNHCSVWSWWYGVVVVFFMCLTWGTEWTSCTTMLPCKVIYWLLCSCKWWRRLVQSSLLPLFKS